MTILQKKEVYITPGGGHETDPERAIAWHMTKLGKTVNGGDLSFSDMLAIVKNRERVRTMLDELDNRDCGEPFAAPNGWYLSSMFHRHEAHRSADDVVKPVYNGLGAWGLGAWVVEFQRLKGGGMITTGQGHTMREAWTVAYGKVAERERKAGWPASDED